VADHVLNYLIKNRLPLTLENYLNVAYLGDKKSLRDVGAEDRAEILALLEEAKLKLVTPGSRRVQ
jgi:hypothetical protein